MVMLVGEEIEHALTVGQCHFITHCLLQGGGGGYSVHVHKTALVVVVLICWIRTQA